MPLQAARADPLRPRRAAAQLTAHPRARAPRRRLSRAPSTPPQEGAHDAGQPPFPRCVDHERSRTRDARVDRGPHRGESSRACRRAPPALDAGGGVRRDGAVAVQRHCAHRRAAVHRGRSAALVHLAAVGAVQLRARAGQPAARGWRAGRPLRAQAPVPRGPRRVRRRLRCRRARGLGRGVDRGARRAGHRCGSDISRRAGARRRRVRGYGTGPRDRHLGCDRRRCDRAGTARRRRARGGVVLACELARGARPGRADRRDGRATRARIACPGRTGARQRGDGRADRGDVSVGLRVARGQPARLELGAGRWRRAGRAAAFAVFVVVEHRVAQPLIAPSLMRNRTFAAAMLVALVFAACAFGPLAFITQLLIRVLHGSPITAGAELLPYAAAAFAVSPLAAPGAARFRVRVTLAGGLLLCAGGLVAMRGVNPHGSWTHLIPGLVVWGAGSGLVNPTVTVAALAVVPPRQSGVASGVNNSARQLGIAAGIAAFGALVQSRTATAIAAGKPFAVAYVHGVDTMLLVAAAIAAAGALTVVALIRTR